MSQVNFIFYFFFFFPDIVGKQVGGGSVINKAYPIYFLTYLAQSTLVQLLEDPGEAKGCSKKSFVIE